MGPYSQSDGNRYTTPSFGRSVDGTTPNNARSLRVTQFGGRRLRGGCWCLGVGSVDGWHGDSDSMGDVGSVVVSAETSRSVMASDDLSCSSTIACSFSDVVVGAW